MAIVSYPNLTFEERTGESGERLIRCRLLTRYFFDIPASELERLGTLLIRKDELEFPDASEKTVVNKFGRLLEDGLARKLVNSLTGKPTFYITEGSGVPLIGSNEFGVVDRGSNILELKPLTGCNFNCVYCSVDEGKNQKRYDYLVEKDYLVSVAAEVAATKTHPVECNIGPHGEPLLYPEIVELVRELQEIPNVAIISVNTNGSLLSKRLVDDLAAAGLTRINLSLPALDEKLASELAGIPSFPLTHLLEMVAYAKTRLNVLLAPVLIPGKNDGEMLQIVELSKSITSDYPTIGIQNYLEYPRGRKPVKRELPWEEFYAFLKELEEKSGKSLTATKEEFHIHDENELGKPFRKGDVVDAVVVMPGRYPGEVYAAAEGRAINVQVPGASEPVGKRVRVTIVRDKHNIFKGVVGKR